MDDKTLDEDSDTSEDNSNSEDLWPIFSGNLASVPDSNTRLQLKSGKRSYQQPVANSDPLSQKLLPAAIPKQAKHNKKKKT
jgi:hypothetical protein